MLQVTPAKIFLELFASTDTDNTGYQEKASQCCVSNATTFSHVVKSLMKSFFKLPKIFLRHPNNGQ